MAKNKNKPSKVFVGISDDAPHGYVVIDVDESTRVAVAVRSNQRDDSSISGMDTLEQSYRGYHNQGLRPRNFG